MLRSVHDDDLPLFFEHSRDPVARHMAAFVSEDPDDHDAFLAHWQRIRSSDRVLVRTIVEDDTVVGHIASFDRDGDHEVTYWLGQEHWGKGIATRALEAFLAEDRQRPIFGRVVQDSVGSRRVLEKCGFVQVAEDRGFAPGRGEEVDEFVLRRDEA